MKRFSLRTFANEEIAKIQSAKVTSAQKAADKILVDTGRVLSMVDGCALYCLDGQRWLNIGHGWMRVAPRAAWGS
jgi:hypothetical protein